ncbi:unnamed protein product [Acanthoscelides obtectus]|uniref:Carboxylic ester hydrolase n=1 Tax=Acanthoscelides obtectus TaxID=200917 RepID=A0A9P0LGH7_ACAOB|nr:unnamed protein product [Acanthoscelides obtectus]CAK1663352.1 hypothetical protein AOBTE_LOCUS23624 [Acanthoscelides obtectus]
MFNPTRVFLLLTIYCRTVYVFDLFAPTGCKNADLTVTLKNPSNSPIKGQCKNSNQGRKYHSFTNIPYAEPPLRERRFQPPEPVQPWKKTFDATKTNKVCLQDPILQGAGYIYGTEDCLVLNVYTPRISNDSSKLLPVLFWIHGGAYQLGSGVQMSGFGFFDHHDPGFFMDEEIVVVTINYRLGALGFLTTEDDTIPANLGLRDQNLALKWVIDNIEVFGGDPKDIVITGESSGASSTCFQLLSNGKEMESVTGAIMISGTCLSPWTINMDARKKAFDLGRRLGLDSSNNSSRSLLKKLQSVPAKDLMRRGGLHYQVDQTEYESIQIDYSPVLAKDTFPKEPMGDAISQGRFHKVPLLFGVNSEECLLPMFVGFVPQIKRKAKMWDEEPSKMIQVNVNVDDRLKAAEDMKPLYTNKSFSDDIAAVVKFSTDDFFVLPAAKHAESASKNGVPVYMYQLAYHYIPHFVPGVEGLAHTEDLLFYWDTTITKANNLLIPHHKLISERMVKILSNFVKYKKPIIRKEKLFEDLEWPEFDGKDLQFMSINTHLTLESDPRNYSVKRTVLERHLKGPILVF